MSVDGEWLAQYARVKSLLAPVANFDRYFAPQTTMLGERAVAQMSLGKVSLPDGRVMVCDPLVYLADAKPYFLSVPTGTFEVQCSVWVENDEDCARYLAVRVLFSQEAAVRFENALAGDEDLADVQADEYFGFGVDAGLACIADVATRDAVMAFERQWYAENPDGNIYDDYFADLFAANYRAAPLHQREAGDWLNWTIPGTDWQMPLFQSGYGDGYYPVYLGFDREARVCQLVIHFIDAEEDENV